MQPYVLPDISVSSSCGLVSWYGLLGVWVVLVYELVMVWAEDLGFIWVFVLAVGMCTWVYKSTFLFES